MPYRHQVVVLFLASTAKTPDGNISSFGCASAFLRSNGIASSLQW
ncbi:MAG: hypothetical protein R2741_14160 [Methanolobus sp.]